MRYIATIIAIVYFIYAATAQAAASITIEWTAPDISATSGYKAYMVNVATNQAILVATIPVTATSATINYELVGDGLYNLVLTGYNTLSESGYSEPCTDPANSNATIVFKDTTPPATMRQLKLI